MFFIDDTALDVAEEVEEEEEEEEKKEKVKPAINKDFLKQLAGFLNSLGSQETSKETKQIEQPIPVSVFLQFSEFNFNGVLKIQFSS